MLRYQPEVGAGPRQPAGPLPDAAGGPGAARLRPAAAVRCTPTTRPGRSRPRSPTRSAGRSTSRPTGSISLSRALRLLRPARRADPAPAVRAAACERLGDRLGAGGAARRRGPPAALRPRRRQPPAARGGRLRARASTPPARSATSPTSDAGAAVGSGVHPGALAGRLARRGAVPMSAARDGQALAPEAIADFLRGVRGGVEAGLDPLAAAQRGGRLAAAAAARRRSRRSSRRLQGDYHEDEWGFDEELRRGGLPAVRVPLRRLVAGRGRRASGTSRPTAARCSSPTTPARCSRSTRR